MDAVYGTVLWFQDWQYRHGTTYYALPRQLQSYSGLLGDLLATSCCI